MYESDNANRNYREYATLWEQKGCKLVRFTLGKTKDKKIIATSKFINAKDKMSELDWFGCAPGGNIAILDVDMHGGKAGFDLLANLEHDLDIPGNTLFEGAYCRTPGGGVHIALEFPEGMLDGRTYAKRVYGNDDPELEFFYGDKFKVILPGAERYDGTYLMTKGATAAYKLNELLTVKLDAIKATKLIAMLTVGKRDEKREMPDYSEPSNWKKGIRHDMFKYWSVRLYDPSTSEEFKILITNAKAAGLSDKQIHSMTEFARRVRIEERAGEFINSITPKQTTFITNREYQSLGMNDGALFFHLLTDRFKIAIRRNIRSGYNEMKFTGENAGEDDFKLWIPYTDAIADKIAITIKDWVRIGYRTDSEGNDNYGTFKSLTWIDKYMNQAEFASRVDPFKVWLERIPMWDGVERLDNLLSECFDITKNDSEDFANFAFRSVLLGAISRTYHPGYKHDTMTVLIGPQGIGKSTFWRELLPYNEWFSDNLNLASDDKTRVESLLGRVIIECSEMHGSTRAEVEALKAFMTRQRDRLRMAYARHVSDHERRCVIVGSSNSENCLPNDPTGNRRFLVIEVEEHPENPRGGFKNYIDTNREQIWAEALYRYVEGERGYMPDNLEKIQISINKKFTPKDELMENRIATVARDLNVKYLKDELRLGYTMDDIYRAINDFSESKELRSTRSEQRIIGGILKNTHGWTSRQRLHDGVRAMRWYPPGELAE